jgi:TolB-like protein
MLVGAGFLAGCGGPPTTRFVHPEFDFSFVENVAVVPFENLSKDQGMGARASRLFISELLAVEAFWVVEPGEVTLAVQDEGYVRTAELTTEQIKSLGRELKVQGLFLGTVNESTTSRGGGQSQTVVSVVVRLVETETGATVWSASSSADSGTFWSSVLGTSHRSHTEVLRQSIRNCLETLLD